MMSEEKTTLTARQVHMLLELRGDSANPGRPWRRVMEMGGWDASPHSNVLMQLVRKGLAEIKKPHYYRASKEYRITEAGLARIADIPYRLEAMPTTEGS